MPEPATATVPASFTELKDRLAGGNVHAFTHEVWRRVVGGSGPAPVDAEDHAAHVTALVQTLVALKLAGAARDLLAAHPPAGVDAGSIDVQLAAMPDGRLEWSRFERTLRENLAVLREHHPAIADRLGSVEAVQARLVPLELHRDAAGLVHVLACGGQGSDPDPAGGPGRWLGGFVDRRAERGYEAPRVGDVPRQLLVLGVGTGRLVDRAVATTMTGAGRMPSLVQVMEPDLDAFAAWLTVADRRAALADPRLLLFVGPHAADDWRALLERRPGLPLPDHVLVGDPSLDPAPLAAIRDEVQRSRLERVQAAVERLKQQWAGRSDAAAAEALRPGATVVGFTSRYTTVIQYAMRDVAAAFESLGYRFVIVEHPEDGDHIFGGDIADALAEENAALVVTFNRLRPVHPALFGDVPVLTFVLDPVDEVLSQDGARRVGRRDVLAGFYAAQAVDCFGYDARRYLSFAYFPVSRRTFHDGALEPADRDRFTCDLVYIGHAKGTADAWHEHCKRSFEPAIPEVLDTAREVLEERLAAGPVFIEHRAARAIVEEACRRTGTTLHERVRSNVAAMHVHRLNDIRWRRTALEWAARWAARTGRALHLHGDGWSDDPLFRPFDRGRVHHDHEARAAYRGARLALQLLPSGLIHQRTLEALCSGTLVVARESPNDFDLGDRATFRARYGDGASCPTMLYQAGLRDLDHLVFASEEEFGALMERWLGDDEARERRQTRDADLVRRSFTWDVTLPRVLDGARSAIALG